MNGHELLLNIAGGVALLLWAARMIRTGILRAYGGELRRLLARSTQNRLSAFAMGLGVTGILQSSTAAALILVSFAGSGLIAVAPGLAVMLGADVGSTLVVQLLSLDLSWFSPALLLAGVIAFTSSDRPLHRHLGRVAIGLGLMLLSLGLIVDASQTLRSSATLQALLAPLSADPILALLLAALLTWLTHSTVAMVLFFMSLVAAGAVPIQLGFALVLGANLGGGMVPMMLSLSQRREARRIPLGNLGFRAVGALVALAFLDLVAPHVAALGADPSRQIANFHTLFNLALAAVFLPLTGLAARLTSALLPESPETEGKVAPRYLDSSVIDNPPVAIAGATREVMRMADSVEAMLGGVIEVFRRDDRELLDRLAKQDDDVDRLYEAIKLYLTKVSRNELSEEDSQLCVNLITFTTNLEHVGDIVDKNLLETAQKKIRKKLNFSKPGWRDIEKMHAQVLDQMQLAMGVFVSGDVATARRLLTEKEHFRMLEMDSRERHLDRLKSGQVESIETSSLHLDILRDLKRIHSHLTTVAYPILAAEGELRSSRLKTVGEDEAETEAESAGSDLKLRRSAGQAS